MAFSFDSPSATYQRRSRARTMRDFHSHLLPGIDDGAKTLDESVALIRGLMALGYTELITTPHVMQDFYPNSSTTIREKEAEVKAALQAANINIPFSAAAEYQLDDGFEALLQTNDLLTFDEDRKILVEVSFYAPPPQLHDYIFRLRTQGYQPVLAHPERYTYWHKDFSDLERLRDNRVLFQGNLLSLIGHYGPEVRRQFRQLQKRGWLDFRCTDLHHERHLPLLEKALAAGDGRGFWKRLWG